MPGNKRAFAYYRHNQGDEIYFNISQFSKNDDKSISKTNILSSATDKSYWFSCYVTFNDIHKIDDTRIAVAAVSTLTMNYNGLVLLLYDLYNNYLNLKRRWYYFDIAAFKLVKELSLYSFNDYLMLTMTGGSYYADLIIFGFANGTDSIIDISPYLMDSFNYNEN